MNKETIAFDLDGTVLENFNRHKRVLENAVHTVLNQKYVVNDDFIEFKRCGFSTYEYLIYCNFSKASEINQLWIQDIELRDYLIMDNLYKGSFESLLKLSNFFNIILVTARNNKSETLKQYERLKLYQVFSEIFIVNPGKNAGKEKAIYTRNYKIQCIIGDTESDLSWAEYLNVSFFPVSWGFRSEDWWRRRGFIASTKYCDLYHRVFSLY